MADITHSSSIIGTYGEWASGLVPDPPRLSCRNPNAGPLEVWQKAALDKTFECLNAPSIPTSGSVEVIRQEMHDGLHIELLQWQLPYGYPTRALFLRPAAHEGPLPGVLALHDHGGNKYLGWRKITRTSDPQPTFIEEHQDHYYGGAAWANELAKRGYAVLVPDAFTFGSRRVRPANTAGIAWGVPDIPDEPPEGQDDPVYIDAYNDWAAQHEHILSKSLFCAGTSWPGVFLREDQAALNILADREEVDLNRLGCCGLSGGGLRAVMLGGLDHRIQCAIPVGFMSTWRDFLMHKAYTHTWMLYIPGLPNHLDFPEILGVRAPLPTLVLNNSQDQLFTLPEMERADRMLAEVYEKAEAADRYQCNFYEGPHKFDRTMQQDAFDWFDKWLT